MIFMLGIILIGGLGMFFYHSLDTINISAQNNGLIGSTEISSQIETQVKEIQTQTKWALGIVAGIFTIMAILISLFLSKFVIYPINRLIKSAEKITTEETKRKK